MTVCQAGALVLPPQRRTTLRILLIEDSRADLDLLVDMLEEELPEAFVVVASSITDAMPHLAKPLDIVITDLSLPDAEGLQALSAILAARPDLAVVVMTGRRDRGLALQAISEGAEDYLVKGAVDARGVATAVLFAAQRRTAETQAHRYERLALSLLDAMEAVTCAVDHDGTIIAVNQAWRNYAVHGEGSPGRTGIGVNYLDVCAAAQGDASQEGLEVATGLRRVLDGTLTRFERDYACQEPSEERWLSVRINPLPDLGAVLSHVDMTVVKRAEQELSYLTLHDPLTNLPNRQLLADRLEQALVRAGRNGRSVAVAFLDIDHFKRINDSLGHPAGDELLRAIATRLRDLMRADDTFARFAGDEFVVVWPDVASHDEAGLLAHRVADALREPFALERATVSITASIGFTVGQPPQQADELLLDADAAMYDAKNHGRARTRLYSDDLRDGTASRLRIEEDLRLAMDRDEFVLHYQPVVDLQTRTVTGVEALIRWHHPDGLRMPDAFIPVAEVTGQIIPMGTWVLDEACRQGAAWAETGLHLNVAVNFSARQIGHADVIPSILQALRRSGMAPSRLLTEVTESSVLEDAELAQQVFAQIRELGAGVAIDDFGTGYSSLLYLKRYPIAALKVDRQFVGGLGSNDNDDAIVASVVALAAAVGADCIAEGVETSAQLARLDALGCRYAQGYLFGRPVAGPDLPGAVRDGEAMLARH